MNSKTPASPATSMFEKVLRAFETRGITYADVVARLRRLLATGASPQEFLAILRRRESAERMPEFARIEAFLIEAMEQRADEHAAASGPGAERPDGEVAVDLEFDAAGVAFDPPAGLRASELDLSVLARHLRSIEERKPARGASLEALTRSYERAREGESVAAERAASLAVDLEAAVAALTAEQGKVRDVEQALTRRLAAANAARDAACAERDAANAARDAASAERDAANAERDAASAARDAASAERDAASAERDAADAAHAAALDEVRQYRAELRTLRDSLAEHTDALDQAHRALADRDARIAALTRDHAALEAALAARARAAAGLEAELRAARAQAEAPKPERAASRAASLTPTLAATPTTSPERPRARPPAAQPRVIRPPTRVVAWGVAALMLAGFAWWFAHRPAPPPAPPAPAAIPVPGTVIRDCPSCPGMTVLPAGRFKQGSAAGPTSEQPLHWVVIGRSIAMSTNPVTRADFEQFATATGRNMQGCDTYDGEWQHRPADSWEHPGFAQTGAHPVTCVSWNDAEAYATWLSARTGHRYRLPSASEWEYASHAGAARSQPWGSDGQGACALANVADASAGRRYPGWSVFPCDDGYVYTAPVGTFQTNPFGLNDMLGNVLQWTADCWHDNYTGAPIDGSAWLDGDCSLHEVRGGSWFSTPAYVRADYRDRFRADYRTSSVGMRLVREVQP